MVLCLSLTASNGFSKPVNYSLILYGNKTYADYLACNAATPPFSTYTNEEKCAITLNPNLYYYSGNQMLPGAKPKIKNLQVSLSNPSGRCSKFGNGYNQTVIVQCTGDDASDQTPPTPVQKCYYPDVNLTHSYGSNAAGCNAATDQTERLWASDGSDLTACKNFNSFNAYKNATVSVHSRNGIRSKNCRQRPYQVISNISCSFCCVPGVNGAPCK